MALYTFLPSRSDGIATTIAMFDLESDTAALLEALQLLEDHQTAESVEIWQASRRVIACTRTHAADPEFA